MRIQSVKTNGRQRVWWSNLICPPSPFFFLRRFVFSLSVENERGLTRNGTAGTCLARPNSQARTGTRDIFIFPCSAHHEQDWQPYPVDPYFLAICDDHTYMHTNIQTYCTVRKQFAFGRGARFKTCQHTNTYIYTCCK